jgi:hypothetical protein
MFARKNRKSLQQVSLFEPLEGRRMLSVSGLGHARHSHSHHGEHHHAKLTVPLSTSSGSHGHSTGSDSHGSSDSNEGSDGNGSNSSSNITTTTMGALQSTDVAAYNELNSLSSADNITLADNQTVYVVPANSTTTQYMVELHTSTGRLKFISDQDGNPLANLTLPPPTPPALPTFGSITDTAATNEIDALAAALNLNAPGATEGVCIHTEDGLTTYTIKLAPASGTGDHVAVTVDAAGNPAGNSSFPFSALPTTISAGLTSLASTDSQTISSTQNVRVRTKNGQETYSVILTAPGQILIFSVDNTGAPATLSTGN